MEHQGSISVTLPETLIGRVLTEAGDAGSVDQVVCVALERELDRRERFKALLREGQAWGRSAGIRSEEDVERIANGELALEHLNPSA